CTEGNSRERTRGRLGAGRHDAGDYPKRERPRPPGISNWKGLVRGVGVPQRSSRVAGWRSRRVLRAPDKVGRSRRTCRRRSRREALESAGGLTVHDIAADGRWLAVRDDITNALYVRPPGSSEDANLSWLDYSLANALSSDGQWVLFNEESAAVGQNYTVAYR